MDLDQWLVFAVVWTVAAIPLGPNALNCMAVSATHGFPRSLWSILGIAIASLCHMAATAVGFAALLLANAELFAIVKLAGAAYLVWMGIALWRRPESGISVRRPATRSRLSLVRRAVLISMSNPKAVLAYLAIFSQFLTPGTLWSAEVLVLVATTLAITVAVYVGYAAAGLGVGRLRGTAHRRRWFNRSVGGFYIAAGVGLATADLTPEQ